MKTRKSLPVGLILLLCFSLLPISASSAQTTASPIADNPSFSCYRDATTITAKIEELVGRFPARSNLITIGNSFENKPIYAFEIGNKDNLNKPHFVLLTGLHGNDFSQPEIGLRLAETLLEGYETDADLRWIVDNVEIDLILLANPDGRLEAEFQAEEQIPQPSEDPPVVDYITNKNGVDLEKNFCFQIDESTENCGTYPFEPETQAIKNYLGMKLEVTALGQVAQDDRQDLFIYYSSHNKDPLDSNYISNFQGKLRIPKFYTPNPPVLLDAAFLRLKELTEMLRIVGSTPIYSIETFKTAGTLFDNYPVDFTFFTYGIASVELSAPPTIDSRPMDCSFFTTEYIHNNIQLLLNAAKSAAQPYKIGYGPIVKEVENIGETEAEILYHAVFWEKNQADGQYKTNPITAVHYYINQPTGMISGELSGWQKVEETDNVWEFDFDIDISGLDFGKHILTLQACSQDEFDLEKEVCGLPLSAFLNVPNPSDPGDPEPTEPPDKPEPPNAEESKIFLPLIGR